MWLVITVLNSADTGHLHGNERVLSNSAVVDFLQSSTL